jgi:hypothetical protein
MIATTAPAWGAVAHGGFDPRGFLETLQFAQYDARIVDGAFNLQHPHSVT